jgi:hypothetical protein
MDWTLKILEGLIIGIGIPFCLHLTARLFPFKPQIPPKEPVAFDELKSKYNDLMVAPTLPFLRFGLWAAMSQRNVAKRLNATIS